MVLSTLRIAGFSGIAVLSLLASACASLGESRPPVPRVEAVSIPKYAGPWFIIGAIGLSVEKGAHDPVETYTPNPDGSIATVFQLRKNAFDGELKTYTTLATIDPDSHNTVWHVTTFWPLKQQYVISHVEPDYSSAIVGRDSRDFVWILSRTPQLPEGKLAEYRQRISAMGYDLDRFEMYPQNGAMPSATARR